jgi:amino acid adenylation domain-containing protein
LPNGAAMKECQDGRISFSSNVSEEITNSFEKFSRENEIFPVVSLSALVAMLLYRYSGEFHVPISVRTAKDDEYIEQDVDFEASPTVRNLLRQVCGKMEGWHLLSGGPDFADHYFIEYLFPQHLVRPLMRVFDAGTSSGPRSGLSLTCERSELGLCFIFSYEESLFAKEMIAQLARHLQNLLGEIIEDRDLKISDLQMIKPDEIQKIVYEWNCAPLEYESKCFQELFDEQVTNNPNAKILLCQDQALTYAEVNSRANGVAHQLRRMGAGPETVVGIGMGRSLDAITAIVGVFKTGAAYCVMDPGYPITRINEIVREASVGIILTTEENEPRFSISESRIVNIDGLLNAENAMNISCKVKLENAAYITFTSGSTGKPKGVISTHRSIAILNHLGRLFYREKSAEVFCLNTQLGFSSVATLMMSLCCGLTIVVIPDGLEKDPRVVALAVEQHQVTNLSIMPSFLRQLFSLGNEGKRLLGSVKRVALSGSEVTWDLVESFPKILPEAKLSVGYASSETCAIVLGNLIDPEGKDRGEKVSLGSPGVTAQVLVLDQNLNPVPIGAPGELYVSSAHLSRGYIGQPAMTAECFLPNPFGRSPGERMYRTGDIVRFRFDGKLEFIGRSDNQVKIRGFRVELEEIEAALKSHSSIEETTVIVEKSEISERLTAYLVKERGVEMDTARLRRYLEQSLPFYMIPSTFVFLDRLPMTANGKIDRKALLLTGANTETPDLQGEAANNPIQKTLIEIWQTVIGMNQIGIRDDFLDLGGDSLIAAIIVMQIRERFNVEVPLALFFEGLTIESLADAIARIREMESA